MPAGRWDGARDDIGTDHARRLSAALRRFHPLVRGWFTETLGKPSAPQQKGWPAIADGNHTLILAPTGTGKTLSAFLWELNSLIERGLEEPLPNFVQLLYVSPLKALNNDIQRNLETPLAQLRERFSRESLSFPEIRVAVRTGDTPASARARMLRSAPHILITTPESLHIMLTTVRGRGMFHGTRTVIVDEIHAIAGTKRGAHLALTLERLESIAAESPQRIGLSATQKPLDEIARFLGGSRDGRARDVTIVDCGLVKKMTVEVKSPVDDLSRVGGSIWPSVAPLVLDAVRRNRTTLVFVNNRAQAEKMAARVNFLAGEEIALPYHGSLSREKRLSLERSLKAGGVRALVSTSALELGIDIGTIDLVLQLQSPKRVAAGLQRVGRAGHTLDAVSRGVLVPTFRDDALEMLAIARAMREGDVEPTRVIQNALDVLAQIIVAATSVEEWTSAELFELARRAYPYHRLSREAFDETLEMLAGKYPSDVAAELDARVSWDRVTDRVSATRASRLVSVLNAGTIPDRGLYTVNLPDRTRLGELDEEFVHETRVGDVFQLGSSSWRVQSIEHDRVIVTPAPGAPARMPFWHGEYGARSAHIAARVGELRRELAGAGDADVDEIARRYEADHATTASLIEYAREQKAVTGAMPDDRSLIAEHFRDETGSVRIVIHAPFGGRVNAPWAIALAQRFREALGVDVQAQTTDDGMMLRLAQLESAPPLQLLHGLDPAEASRRVTSEIGESSLFGARFRMNAARALLLPRGNPRRRMPLWLQRLKAQDLLEVVREFPSFPILVETYRDVLQDAFDLETLRAILTSIERGEISLRVVETQSPSPMAQSLQFGFVMDWMYADDTPRAERAAAILSLDTALLEDILDSPDGIEEDLAAAIEEVVSRRRGTATGRQARTSDELALLLDRAGDLAYAELLARTDAGRAEVVDGLIATGRAVPLEIPVSGGSETRYVLVESVPRYLSAFPGRLSAPARVPEVFGRGTLSERAARQEILARFLALAGPANLDGIRSRYDFPVESVAERLEELARKGALVRGRFSRDRAAPQRWISRRVLEQARRRALAAARRAVEAVSFGQFAHFLQRWQHLTPETRLSGAGAAESVVRQMYGVARPALLWESDFLRARTDGGALRDLATLSASGELLWLARGDAADGSVHARFRDVRFLRRGTESAWHSAQAESELSERAATVLDALRARGASFFFELQQATSLGVHALRDAVRELVVAGIVTNDSVDALLALARWRPLIPREDPRAPDPARWLPADFVASPNRPVVQRRVSVRRLPKWKRPDREGGDAPWPGRWSILDPPPMDQESMAREVATRWLDRYGVVTRDWWRRERPAVPWRAVYRELRRMEMRGDVRRGYFVRGLGGAQFALPAAVEGLRSAPAADEQPVVLLASDPANVWNIAIAPGSEPPDSFARIRGARSILVSVAGRVVITSDAYGRAVNVREDTDRDTLYAAARSLIGYLSERWKHDLTVETINARPAATSPFADLFMALGLRRQTRALKHFVGVGVVSGES